MVQITRQGQRSPSQINHIQQDYNYNIQISIGPLVFLLHTIHNLGVLLKRKDNDKAKNKYPLTFSYELFGTNHKMALFLFIFVCLSMIPILDP
jgi:hypothetical protein